MNQQSESRGKMTIFGHRSASGRIQKYDLDANVGRLNVGFEIVL